MSDVIDRPIPQQEVAAKSRLRIIDCDVHPSIHAHSDLDQFLPSAGRSICAPMAAICARPISAPTPYPRSSPLIARRDGLAADRRTARLGSSVHGRSSISTRSMLSSASCRCSTSSSSRKQNLEFGAAIQRAIKRLAARVLVRPRSAP